MPKTCAYFGCTNRSKKTKNVSFHKFPFDDPSLLTEWLNNISRENFRPTKNHCVCSEHFVKQDYAQGIHPRDDPGTKHHLLQQAIPSIFPAHPAHKQKEQHSRPPPKKRQLTDAQTPPAKRHPAEVTLEHDYSKSYDDVSKELAATRQKLEDARREVKGLKQMLKRRNNKIGKPLTTLRDKNLVSQGQLELLQLNFGENTQLQAQTVDPHGVGYSDP